MEQDGRPLSTIWLEMFAEKPLEAMKLAIATLPKEVNLEVAERPTDTTQINDGVMRDVFAYRREQQRIAATADRGSEPVH
jgi:hypothetical protein